MTKRWKPHNSEGGRSLYFNDRSSEFELPEEGIVHQGRGTDPIPNQCATQIQVD